MLDKSFFVSTAVQEREVELPDGNKHTLYFKELTASDIARYVNALNSKDEEVQISANAKLLAQSLCNADGSEVVNIEQAAKLRPSVIGAMLEAVRDVNGLGEQKND